MTDPSSLPYRRNVGAVIFNNAGEVFVARRTDMPGAGGPPEEGVWQCPQGGIDDNEATDRAVFREVAEETGMTSLTLLGEHPEWMSYDLPAELIGKALKGRYRGQTQKWYALRFTGPETEIRLDLDSHQEFDAWKWVPLTQLSTLNVGFKKPIYENLAVSFSHFS